MKTTAELEREIVNITEKIHNEFPELSKHIRHISENFSGKDNNQMGTQKLEEYYKSLEAIVLEHAKTHEAKRKNTDPEASKLEGYPKYPPSDDIYNQEKLETEINPENLLNNKTPNQEAGTLNKKGFDEEMLGDDLDVPGSELDDQQESVGSEDEENNYYSLGGDNHDN